MSVVAERLSQVTLGEPQVYKNLVMFPLIAEGNVEPRYQLLDDALAQGSARVTEVSESGSVPELKFVNEGERPVLLLDGEELVGAKQNRILNLTVLAPAHKSIVIPVSCVEAGRWRADSSEFASAKRTHYAAGRASNAAHVSESLRSSGTRRSNQSEVWDDISAKSERMESFSDTGAAAVMYETHRARLDDYLGAFTAANNQAGALFCISGEVVGFDLFDSAETLASLLPKLVQSYALDAIDAGDRESNVTSAEKVSAANLIKDAANASVEQFPAVGEGDDLRLQGKCLSGGSLVVDERIIHLSVFRIQQEGHSGSGNRGSRLARASMRRRNQIIE
jgi:hypothetical protein